MIDEDTEDVCVEVWIRDRSPPPDDPRRTVLARLREFEAAGVVDDVSVRIWGRHVPASTEGIDATPSPVHERIAEFRRWADRNGHSLEPAFRRCTRSTMVSEGGDEVIRLPLQCLAVYEDDRLAGVFPCTTDDGTNTVAECLRRLEPGDSTDGTPAE